MKFFLRLESLAIFVSLIIFYRLQGFSWEMFALLILLPDIFMIGYLRNAKVGALVYNIGHSYFTPIILFFLSIWLLSRSGLMLSIIWAAHIAGDRMLGFGLKYKNLKNMTNSRIKI